MKKLIFIIPLLLTLPSYADIASNANSATCDNSTIGATEGSTDLEANWNANSITVNWYNGDTKITTNTCSYDGAVTIPATPTKAGYTFNGWKVRTAAAPANTPSNTPEYISCASQTNQTNCLATHNYCTWGGSSCYVDISDNANLTTKTMCNAEGGSWSSNLNTCFTEIIQVEPDPGIGGSNNL